MAEQKGLFDLVLKIVEGQQQQLDKLSTEIHGGQLPGIKQLTIENRANLDALSETVARQGANIDKHDGKLDELITTKDDVTDIKDSRSKLNAFYLQILVGIVTLIVGAMLGKLLHL